MFHLLFVFFFVCFIITVVLPLSAGRMMMCSFLASVVMVSLCKFTVLYLDVA